MKLRIKPIGCLVVSMLCVAGFTVRAQAADGAPGLAVSAEMSAGARDAIGRQVVAAGKGFVEMSAFTLNNSLTREGVSSVKYSGEARLLQDAIVWADTASVDGGLRDIAHFATVPTAVSLKGLEKGRVAQFWPKGSVFPFAGSAILRKYDEGWRAIGPYGHATQEDGVESEALLNANLSGEMRPSVYIIFQVGADGAVREVRSAKACIEIPAPTDAEVRTAFVEALKDFSKGRQTVESFEITDRKMDPQEGFSGTSDYKVEFKAMLVLARPAITKDSYYFADVPRVGEKAKVERYMVSEETSMPYWAAGEKIAFAGTLELNKDRTGDVWKEPRIRELLKDGESTRLVSPRVVRVRYKYDEDTRETLISDVVIAEKQ